VTKLQRVFLALVALLFCAAPVPGDVGGCGQSADELDPEVFFASKRVIDCRQCQSCGISTRLCSAACAANDEQQNFPEGCRPLVHDGEVCLRALHFASCDDYASYVDDAHPTVPTECDFCPGAAR
jgi:hypothetical protein